MGVAGRRDTGIRRENPSPQIAVLRIAEWFEDRMPFVPRRESPGHVLGHLDRLDFAHAQFPMAEMWLVVRATGDLRKRRSPVLGGRQHPDVELDQAVLRVERVVALLGWLPGGFALRASRVRRRPPPASISTPAFRVRGNVKRAIPVLVVAVSSATSRMRLYPGSGPTNMS